MIGTKIKGYKLISPLGNNTFIAEKDCEKCLLKSLVLNPMKSEFEKKIASWNKLSSSNEWTLVLKDFFYEDLSSIAYIILEYCEGLDLKTLIEKKKTEGLKFTESEISKIVCDLFHGLDAMHRMGIKHGNLNPSDIWISKNGVYKIGIFYITEFLAGQEYLAGQGYAKSLYGAPEVHEDDDNVSYPADVYSIGAILYEVMALTPAFSKPRDIKSNKYIPLNENLGYARGLIVLVTLLLSLDPSKRPSIQDVLGNPLLERGRIQGMEIDIHTHKEQITFLEEKVAALQKSLAQCVGKVDELVESKTKALESKAKAMEDRLAAMEKIYVKMPDYTSGVCKGSGAEVVVEEDGWIQATMYTNSNAWVQPQINGKAVQQGTLGPSSAIYVPLWYPVRKGDRFSIPTNNGNHSIYFYPYIKMK